MMEVKWSPNHDDKFYTFGTNLALYKINDIPDDNSAWKEGGLAVSDRSYANLLSLTSDVQFRCLAWCPDRAPDHLIATGHANGRVLLTTFGKGGTPDSHGLLGKEFAPRHSRACLSLEWNPVETQLLAEVLERVRPDYSVIIWDVHKTASYDVPVVPERKTSAATIDVGYYTSRAAAAEFCVSETVTSLAWLPKDRKSLVAAVGNKHLRIFDMRDPLRATSSVTTRSVYGLTADRGCEHRLASFHESQVSVWDMRNFDKPVVTLQESKPILKLSWNPTRSGLLACLCRDSSELKLYDVQQSTTESSDDDTEPCVTERIIRSTFRSEGVASSDIRTISSFDWHPASSNQMLMISDSGQVADVYLRERIAMCWSPDVCLTWFDGSQMRQFDTVHMSEQASSDIGTRMHSRALNGYGTKNDIEEIISKLSQTPGDMQLRQLWKWIGMMHSLRESLESTWLSYMSGVSTVLKSATVRSEMVLKPWHLADGQQATKPMFCSEDRRRALILCGWSQAVDGTSMPLIDRLEECGEFERAAAVAVFTLKVTRAIEVLRRGASWRQNNAGSLTGPSDLNVVAMAISGFTGDDRNVLWREQCRSIGAGLSNPYLRALFAFLTVASGESYEAILNESKLELADHVAFAALYLPDKQLQEFVEHHTVLCLSMGNVAGMFLTGMSSDGVSLMQRYVDQSGDVQTAAVVTAHCGIDIDSAKDHRVASWCTAYQDLLDTWRLWHQRAEFDVFRCRMCQACCSSQPQVLVSCNFCSKPIAYDGIGAGGRFAGKPAAMMSPPPPLAKLKATCCPQCRKPLPRCSLCLLHLATSAGSQNPVRLKTPTGVGGQRILRVSEWMTWCQTCHHGGHAGHIQDWFREHVECPVSGCSCRCMSLDTVTTPAVASADVASVEL